MDCTSSTNAPRETGQHLAVLQLDLARYRTVYIRLGGLGEVATWATPVTEPFPFVEPIPPFPEWAYDSFGPGRMMWVCGAPTTPR